MWKKGLLSVVGLAAAFFGPLVLFKIPAAWSSMRQAWSQSSTVAPPPTFADGSSNPPATGGSGSTDVTAMRPPEVPLPPPVVVSNAYATVTPTRDYGEVLRFDITPQWIVQRWPRVSTGAADIQSHGFRVPLVTGTSPTDLAGALTYYFNANQQVQRVSFHGATGNYMPLVSFLQTRYHFSRRITGDPSVLIYEAVADDDKSAGTARFHTAPTLKASDTRRRFEIELVIERPAD